MTSADRYSPSRFKRLLGGLNSVSFRDELGEVEYFGQKIVMLRRDAFQLLREELSKRQASGTANMILNIVGRRVGVEEGKAIAKQGEEMDWKVSRFIPEFIRIAVEDSNMGYGKIHLKELDPSSGGALIAVSNCFEAGQRGTSTTPSCFFMSGFFEGLFSQLQGRQLIATEEACESSGGASCMFRLVPGAAPSRWKL